MDWSNVASLIGKAAPLVGSALLGPAGGAAGLLVASALGVEAEPDRVAEAFERDPEAAIKLRKLETDHAAEMRRMVIEAETAKHAEHHATMRAEYASNDAYIRRWRPTFGYMVAITWGLQVLAVSAAILWVTFFEPDNASHLLNSVTALVGALTGQWGVALAVLGVNVAQRSRDKQVAAGQTPPPGILGGLAQRLAGTS